jgi:uncharacterized membrane protein
MKDILIIGILMFLIDFAYLSAISNHFNRQIKMVQNSKIEVDMVAGALCYIALVFGLYYFIIRHMNVESIKSIYSPVMRKHIIEATILGWVIYAVYELTTKALIKNWMWSTVVMDTLWGGLLFGLTTASYYAIYNLFKLEKL